MEPGTVRNERLTATTSVVLVALLLVEGVTILFLRPLLPVHIFVGMLLIPPVVLKLVTTGYRFVRYYTGHAGYVDRGAPKLPLRVLAPVLVAATVVLFSTGVALLLLGPGDQWMVGLHKASFIVWFGVTAIHVLAHAAKVPRQAAADWRARSRLPGGSARRLVVALSVVAGLALGAAALTIDGPWVHRHHHHREALAAPFARSRGWVE